ncbi:hypothetical protein AA0N74_01455 [Chromobacterium vaccinii]|uniref:hypothetical protein n=1 Tax=Chromobacterium vaccinii TaxID=1108595 RepID=UPI0031CF9B9C
MPPNYLYEIDTARLNLAYIYALIDPDSLQAHYVGMTESPSLRYRLHHSNASKRLYKSEKRELYLWFRSILENGSRPRMVVLAEVPLNRAKIEERYFIGKLRVAGEPIINRDKSIFEMRAIAKLMNGDCMSHDYIGSTTVLNWRCNANHYFSLTARRVLSGVWCPTCIKNIAMVRNQYVKDIYKENRSYLELEIPWVFRSL